MVLGGDAAGWDEGRGGLEGCTPVRAGFGRERVLGMEGVSSSEAIRATPLSSAGKLRSSLQTSYLLGRLLEGGLGASGRGRSVMVDLR